MSTSSFAFSDSALHKQIRKGVMMHIKGRFAMTVNIGWIRSNPVASSTWTLCCLLQQLSKLDELSTRWCTNTNYWHSFFKEIIWSWGKKKEYFLVTVKKNSYAWIFISIYSDVSHEVFIPIHFHSSPFIYVAVWWLPIAMVNIKNLFLKSRSTFLST